MSSKQLATLALVLQRCLPLISTTASPQALRLISGRTQLESCLLCRLRFTLSTSTSRCTPERFKLSTLSPSHTPLLLFSTFSTIA
ncbi:hypothetical protein PR003_g26192 [Phytophthora rubi]|uniref:Secreted protein n=1 Tax=Phytophthora rubi TaxID=129364 RepID=A0A6A3I6G6_9STRA|nr:hypothetical protein PR001_g25588 [Phytophthora rubi]KAE8975923.1 hypothetical protein PR002_g25460 [Phytophthora rubi]KAE9286905.1 hypothetical protein PR003_g26192 [Phytophthora rubi]